MSTLRWGVIGTARIATEKVVPAMQRADNCDVVAIASRGADRAEQAARRLGIPTAYGTYEDVLADTNVDAVYIPLPNHLHAEWTLKAALAGKHVLCEKPLALTAADARRMVEACENAGVRLMEAFMYRLHPSWEKLREIVAVGRLGELQAVHSWFSYYNDDPANIRNIAAAGGGALMDIGCYCINLSRMLFGSEPATVSGSVRRDPHLGVDTTTSAVLEFDAGVAAFTCSTRAKADQHVFVYGTEGRASVEVPFNIPPDRVTRVHLATGRALPADADDEVFEFPPQSPYTVQGERFAAAVLGNTAVPTPPEDGVANMEVLERVLAAGR